MLNNAMTSDSLLLRYVSIETMTILFQRLTSNVLEENIANLSASIFSALEDTMNMKTYEALEDIGYFKLHLEPFLKPSNPSFEAYAMDMKLAIDSTSNIPTILKKILHTSQSLLYQQRLIQNVKEKFILAIRKLFIQQKKLTNVKKIIYVPSIIKEFKELTSIWNAHQQVLKTLSLEQVFNLFYVNLKHESIRVREKIILCMRNCIEDNSNRIFASIYESSTLSNNPSISDIGSKLIQELFDLSSKECHDKNMVDALGKCLGSLGAIDPGLVRYDINKVDNQTQGFKKASWGYSIEDMAFHILSFYLLPSLRSESSAQDDHVSYALQAILELLAKQLSSTSSSSNSSNRANTSDHPMPTKLANFLRSYNIYDTMEPYWTSKYIFKSKNVSQPPFYRPNISHNRWLGSFNRWLISICTSSNPNPIKGSYSLLNELYASCRGITLTKFEFNKFIFPRLILDAILTHYDHDHEDLDIAGKGIFDVIMSEIISVLKLSISTNKENMNVNEISYSLHPSNTNEPLANISTSNISSG